MKLPNRKQWMFIVGAAVLIAIAGSYSIATWRYHEPASLMVGQPVPEFALPSLQDPGRTITAKELRGEPYLISVWASWCPNCADEHSAVAVLSQIYGLKIVGLNYRDERGDALRWLEKHGNPYVMTLFDESGDTAEKMRAFTTPHHILVDAEGMIRWKYAGEMSDKLFRTQLSPAWDALQRGTQERGR
jgi:cytochrome c biogenesis protein CcmG, thiol:disulfide interchange protein DsbE